MPDRIIKESICTSDTLNALSDFEERFWWRLVVNCDDYGRFDARTAVLKSRLFPLMDGKTHKDMTNALRKLASVGLIDVYEVDGRPFLQVVKWDKHQRIRAKRSKFPSPEEGTRSHLPSNDVKCVRNPIKSESESESESNPTAHADGGEDDFEVFWAAYPRKVGKKDAKRAFAKAVMPISILLEALEKQKRSQQWTKDNGQYIPYPATWLNGRRWEDETQSETIAKDSGRTLDADEMAAVKRMMDGDGNA